MSQVRRALRGSAALALQGCSAAASGVMAAGPTFRADYKFTGTALTAFMPLGQADWKVQNGEIVGTPKDAAGGWLLVPGKEFQDPQMFANVKCAAGCKAGFLMRAEKTPDGGMKGVLMSVTEATLALPGQDGCAGKEISREAACPAGRGARWWGRTRVALARGGGARGGGARRARRLRPAGRPARGARRSPGAAGRPAAGPRRRCLRKSQPSIRRTWQSGRRALRAGWLQQGTADY